jgi:predicted transglutaminase-like protease
MTVNEYAEQVVNRFITDITDYVFLSIEHDEEHMREYMTNVNRYDLEPVNQAIGRKVMEILNLENLDVNDKPKSKLIKTYTRHKVK